MVFPRVGGRTCPFTIPQKDYRAITRGIVQVCRELSKLVIAEGVETPEEVGTLRGLGIELFQGYYFARPRFQALAAVPPEAYDLEAPPANG